MQLPKYCKVSLISAQTQRDNSHSNHTPIPPNLPPEIDRAIVVATSDCEYCQADRPFALIIPGLDGRLCDCGNWIANCPECSQWRSGLLAIGICAQCKMARDLAKAERKRKRKRRGRKAVVKGAVLATVGGGSHA